MHDGRCTLAVHSSEDIAPRMRRMLSSAVWTTAGGAPDSRAACKTEYTVYLLDTLAPSECSYLLTHSKDCQCICFCHWDKMNRRCSQLGMGPPLQSFHCVRGIICTINTSSIYNCMLIHTLDRRSTQKVIHFPPRLLNPRSRRICTHHSQQHKSSPTQAIE